MKCAHTIVGVFAIVGLGYLIGVGHSLVRTRPVILGPSSSTKTPEPSPDPEQDPEPIDQNEPASGNDEGTDQPAQASSDFSPESDPLLDAPVPDGMLTLRRASELWNEGAYFVDARLRHEYDEGHISLAAHLTAATIFSAEGEAQMQSIPPDATVVIYCLGGDECDASLNTQALLEQFGYTDLSIMGVGYDEWANAGLPTSLNDGTNESEGSP